MSIRRTRGFSAALAFAWTLAAAPWQSAFAAQDPWLASWAGPTRDPGTTGVVYAAGTTVRDTVWATLGGSKVRVKFTNAYGAAPLVIGSASVGIKSGAASVFADSLHALTFGGHAGVTVPQQGIVMSDAFDLQVPDMTDLSISVYLPSGAGPSATFPASLKPTYVYAGGDATMLPTFTPSSTDNGSGYFLSSVEVLSAKGAGVVAAVGDSITQGVGATVENDRWSDRLAARLQSLSEPHHMGVLGLGIAGNRVLSGATSNPSALARFDRDVLGMAGLTHVILADGINDLGSTALTATPLGPPLAEDVEYGLQQLVARAHARGIRVIGTTMGPAWGFRGYENVEAKRLQFNAWMRTEGVKMLDGLVDFDAVLRDPANPSHMRPEFLTDGIHPNNAGHQAMADAVNLLLFRP
jgi:lysophospholipase L1-like esterase